ncbi:hypothetical protein T484DRAFT_3051302 [Baffinella frigidus]|nr:hypothetical protein T484DRAFT_3051302 [Cryptophyta sp. CCMP2293]
MRDTSAPNTLPPVQCREGYSATAPRARGFALYSRHLCSQRPPTPTQCMKGYDGAGSICTACEAGTFKDFMGSGSIPLPPRNFPPPLSVRSHPVRYLI